MSGSSGRDVERENIPLQVMNSKDLHTMSQNDEPIDAIFEKIDVEQSGSIQLSDLKSYLGNTPMCDVPLPNNIVDAFLDHVNSNRNIYVTKVSLKALVNNLVDTNRQSVVHQVLVNIAGYVAPKSQISHCQRHYINQYLCWPPPFFIPLMCILQIAFLLYWGSVSTHERKLSGWLDLISTDSQSNDGWLELNSADGLSHDRKWSGWLELKLNDGMSNEGIWSGWLDLNSDDVLSHERKWSGWIELDSTDALSHKIKWSGWLELNSAHRVSHDKKWSRWLELNSTDGLSHARKLAGWLELNSTDAAWLGWSLNYNPNKKIEAWRFISHIFVHVNWSHLVSNVVWTLVFGTLLEMVHSSWVAILYIIGSISGPLALSTFYPTKELQGSSGGMYALAAAHMANTIINWSEMKLRWQRLLLLMILMGNGIYWNILTFTKVHDRRRVLQIEEEKTIYWESVMSSFIVHIAGAVAGFLLGLMTLRNLKERPWEWYLKWAGLIIFVSLVLACIVLQIVFPDGLFRSAKDPVP